MLGPEGFGHISAYGSVIAHQVLDISSKNLWSFMGHLLRVKIHEHILIHGNITKKTKIQVAGDPVEVEEYVDPDDVPPEEKDAVEDKGTKGLANRQSFIVMRDRMKASVSALTGQPGLLVQVQVRHREQSIDTCVHVCCVPEGQGCAAAALYRRP